MAQDGSGSAHSEFGGVAVNALSIDALTAAARVAVVTLLLSVVAACGGGSAASDTNSGSTAAPPTVGMLTNPSNSGLAQVSFGDPQYVIYAFPGEKTERVLGLALTQPAEFDVAVTEGADILTVIQGAGGYSIVVDSTALAAGTARTYRLDIRNRSTGAVTELLGPVRVMTPTTIASGQVTEAGGVVGASDASLRLEFDAQQGAPNLGVTVQVIDQAAGGRQFRIKFDRDVSADTRGMRIVPTQVPDATARALASGAKSEAAAAAATYPWPEDWIRVRKQFTLFGDYRLRDGPIGVKAWLRACGPHAFEPGKWASCLQEFDAWALTAPVARSAIPSNQADRGEPVLFVHGYTLNPLNPTLGGGSGTWGSLPSLVADLSPGPGKPKFAVFEFQWATNARFADVADDLAAAVTAIHQATDQKVTIVAHSFGGVLARTMLQDLGTQHLNVESKVRQLVTLGTPHSGIASAKQDRFEVTLPDGQDSISFNGCAQITCHEMGEPILTLELSGWAGLLGVHVEPGWVASQLALTHMPASVPVAVGIGLRQSDPITRLLTSGDGLISWAGQRYEPTATLSSTDAALLNCHGGSVEEVVLGGPQRAPGRALASSERGYAHNSKVFPPTLITGDDFEANVSAGDTSHPSYELVARALMVGVCPGDPGASQGPRISSGSNGHTCAVTSTGGVKCWGNNFAGQLGDGTRERRLTAVEVVGLNAVVTSVSVGADYSCALTSTGGVKCWGQGAGRHIGDGSVGVSRLNPVDVLGLASGVLAISAGESEACALTTEGGVKCWGQSPAPVDVPGLTSDVAAVAVGQWTKCVITSAGGVKCWGNGPLGDGGWQGSDTPVAVVGLDTGVARTTASAGGFCAVTEAGAALCWGMIYPGDGSLGWALVPVVPTGLGSGVLDVSTSGRHSCALMITGGVKCWGSDDRGAVGDGDRSHGDLKLSPVDVAGLNAGVIAIGTSVNNSCALLQAGGAKCWGANIDGELGDGTQIDRYTPVYVVGY
jgi:alpha-tubulin suppressor-like RCC1 family protein/pimeloyl-ACP methyl ester carboxylesterase